MLLLPSHFLEHAVFASQVFTEFIAKVTKQNKEGVERFEMISGILFNMLFFSLFLLDKDHCFEKPCRNNGTCTDHKTRYECRCKVGFKGINCES